MAGCPPAKRKQLEKKFKELDTDNSNSLSFEELKVLLKKGNPSIPDDEVEALYDSIDVNGDGVIDFGEFLDYIYGQERQHHGQDRAVGGRHARLATERLTGDDGTETEEGWESVKNVFAAYGADHGGHHIDNKEWAKICKDQKLINKQFQKHDVDLVWTKVITKGKRQIDFGQFQAVLRHVAAKRGQTNAEIMAIVGASAGPVMHATKTDYVRFADDKSTFTGAAAHNQNFAGTDPSHGGDRHAAMHDKVEAELAATAATEGDWDEVQEIFNVFVGKDGVLDGKEFIKFCDDAHLLGKGLTKQDVDVVYASAGHGKKRIGWTDFQTAIRKVAQKKKVSVAEIQQTIVNNAASGPKQTGVTKLEAVRFHDDKSTYTGAHGAVHGREGHDDGRHERLHEAEEALEKGTDDEHPWDDAVAAFSLYAGENGIDSKEFLKMIDDASLFDKKFTKNDIDICFTQAALKSPYGKRKLDANCFKIACRLIANKKNCGVHVVQSEIVSKCSDGPKLHGTEAEYSRFHDDKDTYTGAHVGK